MVGLLEAFACLLNGLAVVAVAGAGVATIAGQKGVRDRLLSAAVLIVVLVLALRLVALLTGGTLGSASSLSGGAPVPAGAGEGRRGVLALASVVVVGHGALAVHLVHRRRQRAGRVHDESAELEAARGRFRPRLMPNGGEASE